MIDQVEEVKDRVDIVDVISSYVTLKKAGTNLKANCPFHNEKSPSFMVSPERQTFKCFGCGEGGDVITFVEKIEGLDFYNALKLLAEKVGVQLANDSVKFGDREFKADKKTRMFEINEWSKKVYHKILLDHPKAEKARAYLKTRGLALETIEKFEIGYAPNSWDFLMRFLLNKKYQADEIVAAGVAIKAEKGKCYDRFRGRIIFPIDNIIGNTIGFTSRILEDDGKSAKYINSSESPIYIKGKTIYGLDKAKSSIRDKDLAVVVEGNMDVIACHQAGFNNVVAASGTALTLDQLKILIRYSNAIALSFDSDQAGQTAMKRAIRLALQNDISTRIITLPKPFKDPDEAIKSDPKIWEIATKNAVPSLKYWIDQLIERTPELTIDDKKMIAKEILPVVKATASAIEREHYTKYLADRLLVSENSLIDALDKTKQDAEFKHEKKVGLPPAAKEELTPLERLFGLIWANEKNLAKARATLSTITSDDPRYSAILTMIKENNFDRGKVRPEIALHLDQLSISSTLNLDLQDEDLVKSEIQYLLSRLRSDQREVIREKYARMIQSAEERGDKGEIKKLLLEFSDLIK